MRDYSLLAVTFSAGILYTLLSEELLQRRLDRPDRVRMTETWTNYNNR